MRPLSATDAIGPAWEHTRRLLWDKRDWRLLLKIGAVAVFAQLGGANFNGGSLNNLANSHSHGGSFPHPAFIAAMVSIIIFAVILGLLISLGFFYLGSRLQFVLFEVVLRSDTTVGPIWRRYGAATWRWIGLKILFFIACFVVCAPILIPLIIALVHGVIANTQNGTLQNPGAFIGSILAFAGAICADFVLVFGILIACIPFGIVGVLDYFVLHNLGTGGHIVMVLIWVLLGLLFAALIIIAAIIVVGYLYTFIQAYALYFLGGRYPLLGQYLAPYWPATHLPVPPPPAYEPPPTPPTPPAFNPPTA